MDARLAGRAFVAGERYTMADITTLVLIDFVGWIKLKIPEDCANLRRWYDAVAVRYGVRINGLDALALTKLDVLDRLDRIEICTTYKCGGRTITDFPSDLGQLAACEPVYESMPGWDAPTAGVRKFAQLPEAARKYIARLEEVTGVISLAQQSLDPRPERRIGPALPIEEGIAGPPIWLLECLHEDVAFGHDRPPTNRAVALRA